MSGEDWGSNEGQKNYMIKAQVLSQKAGIKQTYWYQLGDGANAAEQFDRMGLYYYFGSDKPYQSVKLTDQGIALKTTSDLLYTKTYDEQRTQQLQLPPQVQGAAFKGTDGNYTYVLWAKTNQDLSETATAQYSFPQSLIPQNVERKEWNYAETGTSIVLNGSGVILNSSPAFFEASAANISPNSRPTANAGSDQTVSLPRNASVMNGSGTDLDGTISGYAWTQIAGPVSATIGNSNQASTTIENLVEGVYTFELKVIDDKGDMGADTVNITVTAVPNQAPLANAGADQTITLPVNAVMLSGKGVDADGTITQYLWTKISGPASSNLTVPSTGSTTVTNLVQGVYVFRLTVTDNDGSTGTDDIQITVNAAPNQAPVANAGADQIITLPLNNVSLTGKGTDGDGSIATYSWTKISGPVTYSIANNSLSNTAVTGLVQGIYVFRLTVTDNQGLSSSDDVQITVNKAAVPPNRAPVVIAGSDTTITLPDNQIELMGIAIDVDGTIATYQWSVLEGPETYTLSSPSSNKTMVEILTAGTYVFRLAATDNSGATGADTITLTVKPAIKSSSTASLYPNPAATSITIKVEAVTSKNLSMIYIYNAVGRLIYVDEFARNQQIETKQIDVSRFEKGVYFVNINTDINTTTTLKFVKN
jgi:hypothetical protein